MDRRSAPGRIGNNSSRIFDIDDTNPFNPPSSKAVTITGPTLTKGNGTGNECEWIWRAGVFNAAQLILVNDTIKGTLGQSAAASRIPEVRRYLWRHVLLQFSYIERRWNRHSGNLSGH